MNVYILRNGESNYNGVAVVVARDEQHARTLVSWDYSDETKVIKKLNGINPNADHQAGVVFQSFGS